MSNLGYFQLKAQPGVFNIALEDGRSKDMYHIWDTLKKVAVEKLDVSVLTWEPEVLNFLAKRRPGHEFDTLRDEEGAPASGADGAPGGGMWSSLGSMFGYEAEGAVAAPPAAAAGSKEVAVGLETIHVFSLASGHLYERMLKIMMLSVVSTMPISMAYRRAPTDGLP
ncbi:hypothetical protein T484DRAFT_1856655 [Baffinella frigidus]|nr:hypothetical protein T484DRAFT_1856655 [Cryptophyta sp. CCMP2293]